MEFPKLEKEYPVHVYETGPDGRLCLHSLFDYFQDIASDHAVKLGYGRDELMKLNHFWVLSRIYAEISAWPPWGENIIIKTWPRGTDRLFALRDFEARYPDGRPIALATSSWLIIDRDTKRIQRPDKNLSRNNSVTDIEKALPRNAVKLEPADSIDRKAHNFKVRISDLDINLHTNNARYLKWVTDSYDLDFILNNVPLSAEINYLAESRFNDNVVIMVSEETNNSNVFSHSITRTNDNAELCRIRIHWRNNHNQKQ
jgi:medium-chain acyl-[acyl-carrier-protein] hydrolase